MVKTPLWHAMHIFVIAVSCIREISITFSLPGYNKRAKEATQHAQFLFQCFYYHEIKNYENKLSTI